ncbi:toprim domain-containing protein [Psychrobacter urativorans]|uniref:Oxidoreductase n=1 Tax=Psychrobacter urativorans TaxID=45610 RepID=A0A0M4SYV1_9GAMM|nr:toprim domain-containing protein [Psychrobacter urativorans]ALF60298.1 oxidoreductase [Psychrobacter urativorans]
MTRINDKVVDRLISDYGFKVSGDWLREGRCPDCSKKSLFTHSSTPRVVKCGRLNKCGMEVHVKDLFTDLFTDWSATYKQTDISPNAAADAYLNEGRGLSIKPVKGSYSQELYFNRDLNLSSATIRFQLPNGGWWERIIDQADRFPRKANIKYGYEVKGYWWWHPANTQMPTEIWITEGIFDAIALAEHGIDAVSSISCTNFPEHSLYELKSQYAKAKHTLPKLVWAFDNDKAGKDGIHRCVKAATDIGFDCVAAQAPYEKHRQLDWNDLHEMGRLTPEHIDNYSYFGDLLTATSAMQAAVIMYMHTKRTSFYFEYNYRTWWFELDTKALSTCIGVEKHQVGTYLESVSDLTDIDEQMPEFVKSCSTVTELCNAKLEALYFQRNEITDESWYFMRVSTAKGDVTTTITGDQLSSPSKFKPRLLSVYAGVFWTGAAGQLDIIMRHQTEALKEVKTTDFIGYSKELGAYIFNDVAVHKGKSVAINNQDYFKLGRLEVKSLANSPIMQLNTKDKPSFDWWSKFNQVRGDYGTVVMAWWLGTYFAEQIRGIDRSYPFFELVGQAGAGKSRLLEFLWRLSGREDYEGFDPSKATSVAIYREFAQVSNMPIALIEGDRNDQDGKQSYSKFEWDQLKDAFNGRSIRSRGVKNNGNDTYSPPFRAAIMISQNEPIQASEAMLTRLLHIRLTREGQTLAGKHIVDELDRIPLDVTSQFMVKAIRNEEAILQTYKEKVRVYEAFYHAAGITHTRIALNHAQIAAMVDCLHMHVLEDVMTETQAKTAKSTLIAMSEQRVARLSNDHPLVEQFWEIYEYMDTLGNCDMNHYPADRKQIAINLPAFYKIAQQEGQRLPEQTEMKRLLKSSRKHKFIDSNVAVSSAVYKAKTVKCWVFDNGAGS